MPYSEDCPKISNCNSFVNKLLDINSCPHNCSAANCNDCPADQCIWAREIETVEDGMFIYFTRI